jgi:hypothetical protein
MNTLPDLSQLTHEQLLEFTRQLAQHQSLAQSNQQLDAKVQHLSILNQKYEHELALFKKHKFGSKNEHLTAKQIHLWDEAVEEDIAAVDLELERLNADKTDAATQKATVNKPKRRLLPDHLHTIRIEHEPASTQCVVAANYVVSAKISVKNCISDRHSSIRNSMCVANGSVISVTP